MSYYKYNPWTLNNLMIVDSYTEFIEDILVSIFTSLQIIILANIIIVIIIVIIIIIIIIGWMEIHGFFELFTSNIKKNKKYIFDQVVNFYDFLPVVDE